MIIVLTGLDGEIVEAVRQAVAACTGCQPAEIVSSFEGRAYYGADKGIQYASSSNIARMEIENRIEGYGLYGRLAVGIRKGDAENRLCVLTPMEAVALSRAVNEDVKVIHLTSLPEDAIYRELSRARERDGGLTPEYIEHVSSRIAAKSRMYGRSDKSGHFDAQVPCGLAGPKEAVRAAMSELNTQPWFRRICLLAKKQ